MQNKKWIWNILASTNVTIDENNPVEEGETSESIWSFSSFERARQEMLHLIRAFALSNNGLFDGNGNIVRFQEYLDEQKEWEQNQIAEEDLSETEAKIKAFFMENFGGYDDSAKAFWQAEKLPSTLRAWIMGDPQFSADSIPVFSWTDYMIGCKVSPEKVFVTGVDDGPCNGINPYILINTFQMNDPDREYNFRVRNTFRDPSAWDDKEYYLYIDLIKTEIDEPIKICE